MSVRSAWSCQEALQSEGRMRRDCGALHGRDARSTACLSSCVGLDKFAVARALREISTLQLLRGDNRFRARAWERAADGVEATREPLEALVREGRVREIAGVGDTISATVDELVRNGRSKLLERMRGEFPPGTIELVEIPGMTLGRIRALHAALGITGMDDLRRAMAEGRLKDVRGFGPKTIDRIARGIEEHDAGADEPILLVDALALAEAFAAPMRAVPSTRVEAAGALRRAHESMARVDLVAATPSPLGVIEAAVASARVSAIDAQDACSCEVRIAGGGRAKVTALAPERFGLGWLRATGPEPHVLRLEARARERGVDLERLDAVEERDVYAALELPWVPPELRDDPSSFDRAVAGDDFGDLVRLEDLRGAVHCHTTWSDGKASIEEMARAAEAMGLEYLTITDHSAAAHYANGLDVDRLERQWEEIDRVQERVRVKLLRGTEADILGDGSIDWPDRVLERLDVVVASVHSAMKMERRAMTERLVRAMRHPCFKIWGHALGRLLHRRDPYACDVPVVLDAVAASRAAIEINGDPYRLDLPPEWVREARARGIRFVVGADAHSTRGIGALRFGAMMARRGGVRRSEVLNAAGAADFARAVRPAA